ncbi:sensor histidine kinase [Sphingomonas sp.]|uniref:sensor histidine kinase n=1 Tax=Sphingomonas sp. TaxID=28214 RepID=UPI0035AED420
MATMPFDHQAMHVGLRACLPRRADAVPLLLYGIGFALAHAAAVWWSGEGFYSLWFPAAGLRFALLWRLGARLTPAAALIELAVDAAKGVIAFASPDWPLAVMGIVRPVLAYGLVIAAIRRLASGRRAEMLAAPMPFGLAAVAAPHVAALVALPQAMLRPDMTGVEGARSIVLSLTAFTVGDLLGVLILAPPVLWVAGLHERRAVPHWPRIRAAALAEAVLVLGGAIGMIAVLDLLGLGWQPMPVLLAVAWIGLRFGRHAAWAALLLVVVLTLSRTAGAVATPQRLHLHLGLSMIAVVGYLAGSFADSQRRARADVARRDRLLFQAERLKTLRAMSVAVIHEVSQPLSTLAIEARHLNAIARTAGPEIAASAELIDRKADTLSALVRRLRRFGGRVVDEPTPLPLTALIDSVLALAAPEARAARVRLAVVPVDPDLAVLGQEVELAQAVVNLLRNAIQACEDAVVELSVHAAGDRAHVTISNRCSPTRGAQPGMGVGTLVARAIVAAHGGTLDREIDPGGTVRAVLTLPLIGDPA